MWMWIDKLLKPNINIEKLVESKDIEALCRATQHSNPQTQMQAIRELLRLSHLLDRSKKEKVKNTIANTGVLALEPIKSALYRGELSGMTELFVEDIILQIGSPASETLLKWIEDYSAGKKIWCVSVEVLTKFGDKRVIDVIIRIIEEEIELKKKLEIKSQWTEKNGLLFKNAIYLATHAFTTLSAQEAIPLLLKILKISSDDRDVRRYCLDALEKLGWTPEDVTEKVRVLFSNMKNDRLIIEMGSAAVAPLITFIDTDEYWRATRLLGEIGDKTAIPFLVHELRKKQTDIETCISIIIAMVKLGWKPQEHWHKVLYFTGICDWEGLCKSWDEMNLPPDIKNIVKEIQNRQPLGIEIARLGESSAPNSAIILRDIVVYLETHKYGLDPQGRCIPDTEYSERSHWYEILREPALRALSTLALSVENLLPLECLETLTWFEEKEFAKAVQDPNSYTFHYLVTKGKIEAKKQREAKRM